MLYADVTKEIIGCAMKVHSELGMGFLEVIYQRALEIEFTNHKISFQKEYDLSIYYKDQIIGSRRVDFLVNNKIPVELKAISKLEDVQLAQALNYLEAYNLEVGMLINFGAKSLEFKRLFNKHYKVLEY